MNADWVAATVRARSMAQRRIGAGACRRIAAVRDYHEALALLAGTAYGGPLTGNMSLDAAQRATKQNTLWQLRVLSGWLPVNGTRLARTAAAMFERENIILLVRHITRGLPGFEPFELGALSTAWPRLRTAASADELTTGLRGSAWGDTGPAGAADLPDVLALIWLRRLTVIAPEARAWASAASALLAARILLVDRTDPSPALRRAARPLLGSGWESARSVAVLRESLSPSVRTAFEGIENAEDLWRAEALLMSRVEDDGFRLLRASLPGPGVVLGALAVLSADAWRVRVALAAAAAGTGSSEVLDVMA